MNPIPWYKSNVLRGLLMIVVSQVIAHIAQVYHVDFGLLNAANIVDWLMDLISAFGVWYAANSRISHPTPPIQGSKQAPLVPPEKP